MSSSHWLPHPLNLHSHSRYYSLTLFSLSVHRPHYSLFTLQNTSLTSLTLSIFHSLLKKPFLTITLPHLHISLPNPKNLTAATIRFASIFTCITIVINPHKTSPFFHLSLQPAKPLHPPLTTNRRRNPTTSTFIFRQNPSSFSLLSLRNCNTLISPPSETLIFKTLNLRHNPRHLTNLSTTTYSTTTNLTS